MQGLIFSLLLLGTTAAPQQTPLAFLGEEVAPGEARQLEWHPSESFIGADVTTPVLVAHGPHPGPTLCLTAAVHGDELNGVEIVRRVFHEVDPQALRGTLVGVPIVNLHGFRRSSRYLPDRRDLNRYFPGAPGGSSASRIAHSFFDSIVRNCDALVDLHTGSFHRTNLPQLRADLRQRPVLDLTRGFGATVVVHSVGAIGTLRRAATDAGVPAITYEAGEPMRFQPSEVEPGVAGVQTLMRALGMTRKRTLFGDPEPRYYTSRWVRADQGGILLSEIGLGDEVDAGDVLGSITDPITNERSLLQAPHAGRVLGMALNQVVIPGFAVFRIGIETAADAVSSAAQWNGPSAWWDRVGTDWEDPDQPPVASEAVPRLLPPSPLSEVEDLEAHERPE
ncbi:MAG: succinylglutamate desuccinylase/aspartoacylase family protein [Proteobacteria bacterium]|nr:succinylglutamate desuccinylase/aspartoacylase family protein [Pseudomonadota bacterium]